MATKKVSVKSSIRKGKIVKGYNRQQVIRNASLGGALAGAGVGGSLARNKKEKLAIKQKQEKWKETLIKKQGFKDPIQAAILAGSGAAISGAFLGAGVSLIASDRKSGGYLRSQVGLGNKKKIINLKSEMGGYWPSIVSAPDASKMDDKLYRLLGGEIDDKGAKKLINVWEAPKGFKKESLPNTIKNNQELEAFLSNNKFKRSGIAQVQVGKQNMRFTNKYLGKVASKAGKAAILGAGLLGAYSAVNSYHKTKQQNEKYKLTRKFNYPNLVTFKKTKVKSSIRKGKIVKSYERENRSPIHGAVDILAAGIGTGLAYKGLGAYFDPYNKLQTKTAKASQKPLVQQLNEPTAKAIKANSIKEEFKNKGRKELLNYKNKLDRANHITDLLDTKTVAPNNTVSTLAINTAERTLSDEAKQALLQKKVLEVGEQQARRAKVAIKLEEKAGKQILNKLASLSKPSNNLNRLWYATALGGGVGLGIANTVRKQISNGRTKKKVRFNSNNFEVVSFARKLGSKDKAKRKKRNAVLEGVATVGLGGLGGASYQRFKDIKSRKQLIKDINSQEISKTKAKYQDLVERAGKRLDDTSVSRKALGTEAKEVTQLRELIGEKITKQSKVLGDIGRENRKLLIDQAKSQPISNIKKLSKVGLIGALGAGLAYGGYSYINRGSKKNK